MRRVMLRNAIVALHIYRGGEGVTVTAANSACQNAIVTLCDPEYAELRQVYPGYYIVVERSRPGVPDPILDVIVAKALTTSNMPWKNLWFNHANS